MLPRLHPTRAQAAGTGKKEYSVDEHVSVHISSEDDEPAAVKAKIVVAPRNSYSPTQAPPPYGVLPGTHSLADEYAGISSVWLVGFTIKISLAGRTERSAWICPTPRRILHFFQVVGIPTCSGKKRRTLRGAQR